jgi:hypothetical protein
VEDAGLALSYFAEDNLSEVPLAGVLGSCGVEEGQTTGTLAAWLRLQRESLGERCAEQIEIRRGARIP